VTRQAPAAPSFAQVEVSFGRNTCGVTPAGKAYCWGVDNSGELGADSTLSQYCGDEVCSSVPVPVAGDLGFTGLTGGFEQACGLTAAGEAYCWGSNHNGELGRGDTIPSDVPAAVSGGLTFALVSAGVYHTCGLTRDGIAYCWGDNFDGALGNGESGTSHYVNPNPVPVSGGLTFRALGGGWEHTCGLSTDVVYCWGYNKDGDLGNNNPDRSTTPVPVSSPVSFDALSVGQFHECALTSSGAAYCWGGNFSGQLGTGDTQDSSVPIPVLGGLSFASISAGYAVSCGVTQDGTAYCWGDNSHGELGTTQAARGSNTMPFPVSGNLRFNSVSTGYLHTCGATTDGQAYCWGTNADGELGDGSFTLSPTPVLVLRP
jgi:alpha-tubulin suppressor-like RCC1 family protein